MFKFVRFLMLCVMAVSFARAAETTVLVEDNFTGIAAGDVFTTGDNVGQWNQGTGSIPGTGKWQSNQTGQPGNPGDPLQAPKSDGNGVISFTCLGEWDQYIDSRNFG